MITHTSSVRFGCGHRVASGPLALHIKPSRRRLFAAAALLLLTAVASGLVFGLFVVKSISDHLPKVTSLTNVRLNPPTTIVSSDGVTLASLQLQMWRPVPLAEISPTLQAATIATEDSRFYEHSGVDLRGIARAIISNVRAGNASGQGGSTITQQLARSLYLSNEKTYRRKIAEALLARRIEAQFGKAEILEAYLNTAYYGSGCYGVEAAANTYFGKSAKLLSAGEATLLAGLPQRPLAFTPTQHLDAALRRRHVVLSRMVATGKLTSPQAQEIEGQPLKLRRVQTVSRGDWKAPYFVSDVVRQLRDQYGPEFLYSGVRVVTTLNWKMQQAAEAAIRRGLPGGIGPNTGALVAIDPSDGYVRALVGGANFKADQFDAVTQGVRQPGSAFKPFVYAAAFDSNACDLTTEIDDHPLSYHSLRSQWIVHNYGGGYHGKMTVLDGLRHSVNTVAVQVMEKVGPANVADYAARMGITTPLDPVLPLALGASGVHPLDICSAYTAFANNGARCEPAFVQSITDADGRVIFNDETAKRIHAAVLGGDALDQINVGLREVVMNGTGAAAAAIPDAHGKTGTTSSHRDAWFVGYTHDMAVAVWTAHVRKETVARQGVRTVLNRYMPMGSATGGDVCAPIWREFMARALPEQRRIEAALGVRPSNVVAPERDALLASLRARNQDTPGTDPNAPAADGKPVTEIAQNGSPPEVITAPPDDAANSPDAVRTDEPADTPDQPQPNISGNIIATP